MTKKEFIWLLIRFLGIFKLVLSLRFILTMIGALSGTLIILPASTLSEKVVFFISFLMVLENLSYILVAVYLVFFGKTVFNIIYRTSEKALDTVLEKQNYVEILIRFVGLWWLWESICRVCRAAYTGLMILILSHPKWILSESQLTQEAENFFSTIMKAFHDNISWNALISILLFAALAFYFLKHGKFFINLLNRLWLKETNQNLIQNPDGSV